MRDFEYYLGLKDVRKCSPDRQLAISLANDMNERMNDAARLEASEFPKLVFETFYDALRDFCDALLALEGYKSYSHEGSISFLAKKGFDTAFISALDGFRYKRNGSKYYGAKITFAEAEMIKKFYGENKKKIDDSLKRVGLK
jgi:uncharacterized protein (UPF0332 family)